MLLSIKELPRKPKARGVCKKIYSFECDVCKTIFEGNKGKLNNKRHYCHINCFYKDDKHYKNGKEIECTQCSKLFYLPKNQLEKGNKWGHFCCYKCYGDYRSAHPELYTDNFDAWQKAARGAYARSVVEKKAAGTYVHSRTGKHLSDEAKAKIGRANKGRLVGDKNPMKKGHTEESRQKMSDTRTRLIIEGKLKIYPNNHKAGEYESMKMKKIMKYKSSWELALMKAFDHDQNVVSFEYESLRIPYYYDNHKRWYIPDFIVTFSNGTKKMLEIKPAQFLDNEKTKLKSLAAQEYCKTNLIDEYQILTKKDILAMYSGIV